jgi:membrane fusion protein (multidrug efflux system)
MVVFFSCSTKNETKEKPPVQIQYVVPNQSNYSQFKTYVGQTLGNSDVQIVPRVKGLITGIYFKEGEFVQKGKLLYTIDEMEQKSNFDEAQAALQQAKSELVNAQSDYKRIKPLADMNAVSQRDLDAAKAKVEVAQAKVDSRQASLSNQRLNLSYTQIVAPVSGVIGISSVRIGDYVSPFNSKSVLNTISDISEIRVRFSMNEVEYLNFAKQFEEEKNNKLNKVQMILSNDSLYDQEGVLNTKDRSIDPTTGTMSIEALFPNKNKTLLPGQYVKIKLKQRDINQAILIPARAVREIQGMFQVYCINDKNQLEVRIVEVGTQLDNLWEIKSGIKPNDRVAILGNLFLQPGTLVDPVKVINSDTK